MQVIKRQVALLNLFTSVCNKVFELSFSSSIVYKCFAKLEVAIIDNAVILNPVVIERKVAILLNASSLSILKTVIDNST